MVLALQTPRRKEIQRMVSVRTLIPAAVAAGALVTSLSAQSNAPVFAGKVYPATGEPRAIVTADFNNDGRPDLAVAAINAASPNDGAVTVFGNNGDGTFTARNVLHVTAGPFAMVSGDFNNDGDPDLAVVDADAQVVTIQLHTKGTAFDFSSPGSYVHNGSPRGITTGDFNRDGRLDLAITSLACNCVNIALGNGNGTFLSRSDAAVGRNPLDVVTTDIDHDGLLDLITGGSNGLTILFGSGSGKFGGRVDEPLGFAVQSLETALINRNVRPDVAAVGRTFISTIWDVTRAGSGQVGFDSSATDARGVGIVDINGDGVDDLIVADRGTGLVTVWIANTAINSCGDNCAPGYTLGAKLTSGGGVRAIAIADFNVDGRPDIASADQSGHSMTVFLNTTPFVGRP
jgi:hypothetical protein